MIMSKLVKGNCKTRVSAFTLSEMAIVIASIAVLILLVMAGSALINKASSNSVLAQISEFNKAVDEFKNIYGALPGDLANVSALPGASTPPNTAGNGVIDSGEVLLFWQQLSLAGLIRGKYDGVSANVPGLGIPASSIRGAGYRVVPSAASGTVGQEIVFELSGYSNEGSTISGLSVMTPSDAKEIDESADDGKPNSGIIRASNGPDGGCVSSGSYSVTSESPTCLMQFYNRYAVTASGTGAATSACSTIGMTRVSPTEVCPVGYVGNIIETCKAGGSYSVSERNCEALKCSSKESLGDNRVLSCPPGYSGTGVKQVCDKTATWKYVQDDCVAGSLACAPNGSTQVLSCPWGEKGAVSQTCTAGLWATGSDACTPLTCGASALGSTRTGVLSCGSNYTGTVTEACTMDQTWKPIYNDCVPVYTGTCTVDNTRTLTCPPGESGAHQQKCVTGTPDNFWVTVSNSCKPVTCGGEPIGATRPSNTQSCPTGTKGIIVEICQPDGTWATSNLNCTPADCQATTTGYATWPTTAANSSNVTGTCVSGYTYIGSPPTRNCNTDGTWSTPTKSCVITPTEAIPFNGLKLWLDANDPNAGGAGTQPLANSKISTWVDRTGNGNNATQSDTTVQPTFRTNSMNGKPTVEFYSGNANTTMALPTTVINSGNSSYSVIAVLRSDVLGTGGYLGVEPYGTNGQANAFRFSNGALRNYWWNIDLQTNKFVNAGQNFVIDFIYSNAAGVGRKAYLNGELAGTDTATTRNGGGGPITLGKTYNTEYWDGSIAELLVYDRPIDDCERRQIDTYLTQKWGITNLTTVNPGGICSDGLVMWLDATPGYSRSDIGCTHSDYYPSVGCWLDRSGKNNNATSGSDPQATTLGLTTGYSALWFRGSPITYLNANSLAYLGNKDYTILAAVRAVPTIESANTSLFGWYDSSGNDINITYINANNAASAPGRITNKNVTYYGYQSTMPVVPTQVTSRRNYYGNSIIVYQDQNTTTKMINMYEMFGSSWQLSATNPIDYSATAPTRFTIGQDWDGNLTSEGFRGHMMEFIVFDRVLSAADADTLYTYLKNKWGIPFSPVQLPGLKGWYDAANFTQLHTDWPGCSNASPTNGLGVACITDRTGTGYNFSNGSTGFRPLYRTSAFNNRNTLDWDGVDDRFHANNNNMFPTGNGSYSLFAALRTDSLANRGYFGVGPNTPGAAVYFKISSTGQIINAWNGNDLATAASQISVGVPLIISTVYNNSSNIYNSSAGRTIYKNGNQLAYSASTIRSGNSQNIVLGATDQSFEYWDGYIGDVIIYDRELGPMGREEINSFLSNKYNIPINFPSYNGFY